MLAVTRSACLAGVVGHPVAVEVHVTPGLPGYTIVGLPDTSCRESRDRVRAAIVSSGKAYPQRRVTVNLAPSELRKLGAGLDVAMAVALLVASEELKWTPSPRLGFLGELGLDGTLRPVRGVLPMAAAMDVDELVVAVGNAAEASLIGGVKVRPVGTLLELIGALSGEEPWPDHDVPVARRASEPPAPDLSEVRGQPFARLAVEVAAAGSHHLLMVGAPGAGKTMLAERIAPLLDDLDDAAALDVSSVHSAAGELTDTSGLLRRPPFRAPHHTASVVSIIGGGTQLLRPGEVSLAHQGVLFLDELGEFPAHVLDALRQPLESGAVQISRAHVSVRLPARFLLVGAMNPCPCGQGGSSRCSCSEAALQRYARRVSGPLLDRFDLRLRVHPTPRADLVGEQPSEPTSVVRARVRAARAHAAERGVRSNADLDAATLRRCASFEDPAQRMLEAAIDAGRLSGRGFSKVRRVALTLDDLRGGDGHLDEEVVSLALALRSEIDLGARRVVMS